MTTRVPTEVGQSILPAGTRSGPGHDVLAQARVVIVDDEQANVRLLERILLSVGVTDVHGVTDPRQAVQRCLELDADLVLLDLRMPHKDGFTVLSELHAALPEDAFVPVLVLTADHTTAVRDGALQAGAMDFLTKPVDQTEVVLRVRNILQTRALYVDVQQRNTELNAEVRRLSEQERRREQERLERLARIDDVLSRDRLAVVFQPIVDLGTGATAGVEALARFSPEPYRPPNEWFDDASLVGRRCELEVAAARAALAHLDQVPPDAFLAVNVAAETATSAALQQALRDAPGDRIVLELTEHAKVEDYADLLAGLAPLRERGFRIAVDDAGAGYAGLHHVLQLRPEVLKLDLDLIRDIDTDPAKRALSTALVLFAEETGATIIAEGIETSDELETLRRLGVGWGQGFHLARPGRLPAL